MFLPNIRALAVVCWIMSVRNTVSKASVPAPTLKLKNWVNASNIVLNTYIPFSCDAPSGSPFPVQVSVGKLESPSQTPETTEAWWTSDLVKYPKSVDVDIPATAKFEGKVVCWYQSTRTELKNSYSQFSNNITLAISALPPPKVALHPNVFVMGGNYTVFCNSTAGPFTNFTLSLYYRIMPVIPGTNWTFLGSVFLTDVINIFSSQTNSVIPIEFACTMEMLYNGKVLHSPQSNIEQAIPEELPVRLWEQDRGESCLGYLDVKLKGKWEPVCQKDETVADHAAAFATAEVVCRELGCGDVLQSSSVSKNNRQFSYIIGGIRCSGKEQKTRDCPLNEIEVCKKKEILYIICSDTLPPPKLSVVTYGPVPKLYVRDKQNVELSCSFDSTYLKQNDYGYIVFRKDGVTLRETYTRPGYSSSISLYATVQEGEYDCVYKLSETLTSVSQPSNTVFIYIYNPPNPGPIVAGVLTTVFGVAIMTYICVFRTSKQEEQSNEFPAHSQDPATNAENPDKDVHIPQQP